MRQSTIVNTKLLTVCFSIMKNIRPYSDEDFGAKVLEHEKEIYKIFGVTDDVRKMKLLEDIVVYSQYIDFMNKNIDEKYDEDSEYEDSEYDEDSD